MSAAQVPSGMTVVSKAEFFALLMSTPRDIMPRCEREQTFWEGNHTRERWGWSSAGWVNPGHETFAVLAAIAKATGETL